ncbi:MAG: hypothetical protein U1F61_28005 [Opitutaceae bacterium]
MDPRWHLSHARGYLELGMLKEAASELDALPPALAASEEALAVRASLHQERKDWPALQIVSKQLVQIRPDSAGAWIMWAYATRRAESLVSAERILTEARELHPKEPTVLFNLGCYACQRGDLAAARTLVEAAIALDSSFATLARQDDDLAPLRASRWSPPSPV